MHLKLQKAMLEEQLKRAEMGATKCIQVLQRKKERRAEISNIDSIPLDELTMTRGGVPLSSLRLPHLSVKSFPRGHKENNSGSDDPQPTVTTNTTLLRVKNNHLMRTIGGAEVSRRKKEVEDTAERMKRKHKTKKYPSISVPMSMLPRRYELNELPCTIEHGVSGHYLSWACPLENLDYEYYLPIFFDGLQVKTEPVCFLARQGIEDLLTAAKVLPPAKVIACLKGICLPLRNALSKYDPVVVLAALKAIQQLVLCNKKIGEALLPFCKQFIGPMSMFLEESRNLGDGIDYGQRRMDDIGDEIRKTLELLEETGGPMALKYIKGCIPVYETCMRSRVVVPSRPSTGPASRPSTAPSNLSKK